MTSITSSATTAPPRAVARVLIPDSKLAHEITELVQDTESPPPFNHSSRVFYWGALTGVRLGLRFDVELLYAGAMFRDMALKHQYSSPDERFEVDGANTARDFLRSHGISRKRTMQAATTDLIDQRSNVYWSSSLADVEEEKEDQLVPERGRQLGSPVFRGSQPVSESRRSTTVAPQIRESLAALVINIDACRRWLSADPPNIGQARAAMGRMTCNANTLTKLIFASGHDDHA
jgi:hypothetical protein